MMSRLRCLALVGLLGAAGSGAQAPLASAEDPSETSAPDQLSPRLRAVAERAVEVRPHPRQMAWQELEFTCFIHFGVNTFTGVEWGSGKEDPSVFRPTRLDAEQWVRSARAAGMKLMLLTAKHHDGFCLWPSAYTDHSVKSSPWRDGKGDVVGAVARACAKYGLKMGVYLSPADLHEIEREGGYYGNGSPAVSSVIPSPAPGAPHPDRTLEYHVDDYNRYFLNQLHELLTRYGPIHEVWFDGANPKPGTGQTYAYRAWYDLIRTLAPGAVIAIKGPDVRWCGNEAGRTRPAEWSVIPLGGTPDDWHWPDMTAVDLGSLEKLAGGAFLHWYPAETNTSIRHGWFWRDEAQHVKDVDEILDIWYRSVGGNTVFLLNVPPDRRGLFGERDRRVLEEVGRILRETFGTNLALGATATASASRGAGFEPSLALDGDSTTCWMPPDWTSGPELVIRLPEAREFDRVVIQEQIRNHGQRIARFAVDVWIDGGWSEIARGTTVGYKHIARVRAVKTDRLRLRIPGARVSPTVAELGLYREAAREAR